MPYTNPDPTPGLNFLPDWLPNCLLKNSSKNGSPVILRFFSSLIDRVFFSNSDFKIVEHEYFGVGIFVIAILVTFSWLNRTKDIRKKD